MNDPFDSFLVDFSAQVGEISKILRETIHETAPDLKELFNVEQKHLSYSTGTVTDEPVLVLSPKKEYVFLVFRQSKHLSDPDNLLGGAGKQSRFMTVRTPEDARTPAMKKLIQSAWENAVKQAA